MVVVGIDKRKEGVGSEIEELVTCKHMVGVVICKCKEVEVMVMEVVVIYKHKVVEEREMGEVETCECTVEVVMEKVVEEISMVEVVTHSNKLVEENAPVEEVKHKCKAYQQPH